MFANSKETKHILFTDEKFVFFAENVIAHNYSLTFFGECCEKYLNII